MVGLITHIQEESCMKIPISWLKDYVDIDCDAAQLADVLTMSGSKVEKIAEGDDKRH